MPTNGGDAGSFLPALFSKAKVVRYFKEKRQMDIAEVDVIVRDLTAVFQDGKECKIIENVKKLQGDIDDGYKMQGHEMKKIIKALAADVKKVETEGRRREPKEAHKLKMAEHERERGLIERNINELADDIEDLKAAMQQLSVEEKKIKDREEDIEEETTVEVPRVRTMIALYTNITKLKWAYDTDKVQGSIMTPSEVRTFSFEPEKHSKYHIANELWDLME